MQTLKKITFAIILICLLSLSAFAADDTVLYVADGGKGDGLSAGAPLGSFTDIYATLGEGDTTIVVCGKYTVTEAFIAPAHSGKVTVTSVYGGTDYRKNGAELILGANFYCGGETLIDNIKIVSKGDYTGIFANYKNMTVGNNVTTGYTGTAETYPCIVGGSYYTVKNTTADVVIGSGTWSRVRLGNGSTGAPENVNVNLTINGGTFNELVYLTGGKAHTGDFNLTVNGGTFKMGIVGASMSLVEVTNDDGSTAFEDSMTYTGNMTITFNDGNIGGRIRPRYTNYGTLNGTWNIVINGGDFSHCAEIVGTADISTTMTSSITYGKDVDINKKETGTYSFTNPIRYYGADPWLFFHNGSYYYIATGGNNLMLYKAANIGDLSTAAGTVIYDPEDGKEWSCNMWSPEIHYFSADMVGKENAGWYMFLCSDDGNDWNYSGMRAYVVKCLDGDNLMGRWGHPITGEVNVPQKVIFQDSDYNENELCGGLSVLVVNGQPYITFVSEVGRDTSNFYQTLNIAKFSNPWTIVGEPVTFCTPTYDWEKYGGGDGVHPYTVECSTAVYGSDGSIYIAYAGSAYWTPYYCIGQLKLVGNDPMVASNWQKKSTPIFSQSSEVNGSGHASFVTDTDGNGWACYHGYITGDEVNTGRYAFVEPYSANSSGITIGNGSKMPAPLSTKYTVNVNPTPIADKLDGFTVLSVDTVTKDGATTVRFNPIEDAQLYIVRRDGKLLTTTTENYYVDTEATLGWHTYKVDAVKGGIIATATVQGVCYNGLTYGDMDSDSDIDVLDALLLLKDVINHTNEEANIIDVVRILRCV